MTHNPPHPRELPISPGPGVQILLMEEKGARSPHASHLRPLLYSSKPQYGTLQ